MTVHDGPDERWTHAICDTCWSTDFGYAGRQPVRLKEPDEEACCWCGTLTESGIYVRMKWEVVHG